MYGSREVEKLLKLPRSTIRAMVEAGFVTPERGPRNSWRFSFQDMIVLRAAQALSDAQIPPRRITRSLQQLRKQLPDRMPLSGLSIGAVGDRVVVRDGSGHRQADSGQYLLAFEGDPRTGSLSVIEPRPPRNKDPDRASQSQSAFEQALAAETDNPDAAMDSYRQAISVDPTHLDARINLGRLLHEAGRLEEADAVYQLALEAGGKDPLLLYNLAVLQEDLNQTAAAIRTYESALELDPDFADCCYNLALLYRKFGKPQDAIRLMSRYRRLMGDN